MIRSALLYVALVALLFFGVRCSGGGLGMTRAQARGAVLVTAEAVRLGDVTCGRAALETRDLALARVCERAYDDARSALLVASTGVDAWSDRTRGEVACAIARAARELELTARELRARNVEGPRVLDDALALASGAAAPALDCRK